MCPVLMEITTGGQSRQVTTGFTASRGIRGGGLGQRPGGDGLEGTWRLPGGMGRGVDRRSPGQWGEEPPAELERPGGEVTPSLWESV